MLCFLLLFFTRPLTSPFKPGSTAAWIVTQTSKSKPSTHLLDSCSSQMEYVSLFLPCSKLFKLVSLHTLLGIQCSSDLYTLKTCKTSHWHLKLGMFLNKNPDSQLILKHQMRPTLPHGANWEDLRHGWSLHVEAPALQSDTVPAPPNSVPNTQVQYQLAFY